MAGTVTLIGGLALWYRKKTTDRNALNLRWFTPDEFGPYWPLMNIELLMAIDEFRDRLGYRVSISPAFGAIGRPVIGANDKQAESGAERSYHNYLVHGEILALDVMPDPPGGATPAERARWYEIAKEVGFRGFGVYPDWRPRAGVHLDMRPRSALRPGQQMAEWSGRRDANGKQQLLGIEAGFV